MAAIDFSRTEEKDWMMSHLLNNCKVEWYASGESTFPVNPTNVESYNSPSVFDAKTVHGIDTETNSSMLFRTQGLRNNVLIPIPKSYQPKAERSLHKFRQLIDSRIKYLKTLHDLPSDWIDGTSETPSDTAISNSTSFLAYLNWKMFMIELDARKALPSVSKLRELIPKLVMGPIPIGGISIEVHWAEAGTLYVTFSNEGMHDVVSEIGGKFHDLADDATIHSVLLELDKFTNHILYESQEG